jgi:hypothetical protein
MIAAVDEQQFEAVRRWGEGLRGDPREEVRAAGQAIFLLCAEVDRLERDLWNATVLVTETPSQDGEAQDDEHEVIELTLRERVRALYSRPARH